MQKYHLFEVLTYGPIVAHDAESGIIVTVGKECFSAWTEVGQNHFVGTNSCLIADIERVGNCTDFALVVEVAKEWILELLLASEEDEPSNS